MISKTELIKLFEELEQFHDREANNYNDELLSNPDEYRKLAYERANGIRDSIIIIYYMDEIDAISIEWLKTWILKNVVNHGEMFDLLITDWEKENEID